MKLPYLIAEIGLNFARGKGRIQDWGCAAAHIEAAAEAGADGCKFQAVWPQRLVSGTAPTYFHQEGEQAHTQREFFERSASLTRLDYEELAKVCQRNGVDFLCTPFDVETVEWLNPLVPAFKIASADITNVPLLEAVARTGKPVYLSTGAATAAEVEAAIHLISDERSPLLGRFFTRTDVVPLHCVLSYPTPPDSASLAGIARLRTEYGIAGYSDHTLFNLDVLTTAWLLGATVIEKHFTLDKTLPGNDHYHSMDLTDLRALVAKFKELQAMIGDGEKRVLPCEEAARLNARQSWHAARDLPAYHLLRDGDVVLKRPATGMPASYPILGAVILEPVRADEPITQAHIMASLVA